MSTAGEISGGKRYYSEPRTHRRHDMDFYVEPRWVVDALLDAEEIPGPAWDPACGSGTIPRALRERGVSCRASDAADRGAGDVHDFLGLAAPPFARPSMPPGDKLLAGEVKAAGGKMDYCWMIWCIGHKGATTAHWLRRPLE